MLIGFQRKYTLYPLAERAHLFLEKCISFEAYQKSPAEFPVRNNYREDIPKELTESRKEYNNKKVSKPEKIPDTRRTVKFNNSPEAWENGETEYNALTVGLKK